ncbi:MAG: hypothetical protein KIH08_05420 [Candidatus Freyarchaeota archaeon]|nr:hypothetical protein [Candidatus Jordarchaeia archaeon]MBS7269218.1 hypothetical protein [Candidatus Jordarchaeia archaeon]MBS7279243.1 hypothetical protein [Candidatus Jordarchaeia archaeon]
MNNKHSDSMGFIRANRDAVSFTTLFPSLGVGQELRRKFIDQCIKKFCEKKPILPAQQVRKLIDVFYSRGIESIIARVTRLLSIPAELPELVTEITGLTSNGNSCLKTLIQKVEKELSPILEKDGRLSVLKYSPLPPEGTHQDWNETRKLFDAILHSPPLVNKEEIIKITQNFSDNPKLILKQLHDNKIINLQGLGRETLIWKVGIPPLKNIVSALREIRQKKLEVTTLQILQHQTINQIKSFNSQECLLETLEILVKHRILKEEGGKYQIDQYASISLEAAINDVTPLIQLYRCI